MSVELEQDIDGAIAWLQALKHDLKVGTAQEVPAQGHVWYHWLPAEPISLSISSQGAKMETLERRQCADFLKLWGYWFYIATCPRTGIRFVEVVKR